MLKSVVLFVFLWRPIFCASVSPKNNEANVQFKPTRNNKQIFYVNGPLFGASGRNSSTIEVKLGTDNLLTDENYVHMVHRRLETWPRARQICVQAGGHLAVINSQAEQKILLKMMADHSVYEAWVGYHDLFIEGDWTSVLDEPLITGRWNRWSNRWGPSPDGGISQNCAAFMRGGIDDQKCLNRKPFICKKSTESLP